MREIINLHLNQFYKKKEKIKPKNKKYLCLTKRKHQLFFYYSKVNIKILLIIYNNEC